MAYPPSGSALRAKAATSVAGGATRGPAEPAPLRLLDQVKGRMPGQEL